jgi:hypothetical protein
VSTGPERREIALRDGTVVEAIIGYRSWRLWPDDGTVWLVSAFNDTRWPQLDPLQIRCDCARPERVHTCGIHAWNEPPALLSYYGYLTHGEVALWGDVRIHQGGYRADFARPVSLVDTGSMSLQVAAVQYDIPMVTRG